MSENLVISGDTFVTRTVTASESGNAIHCFLDILKDRYAGWNTTGSKCIQQVQFSECTEIHTHTAKEYSKLTVQIMLFAHFNKYVKCR